jgi:glycosyl transferase, family 25
MNYYVINLDRTPERLTEFIDNNKNFSFERVSAVDGRLINREQLVQLNIITKEISDRYTDGAIGVALSHKLLWEECIRKNTPITVFEDDAVINHNLVAICSELENNPSSFDMVYWGCNHEQGFSVELLPKIETQIHLSTDDISKYIGESISHNYPVKLYRCLFAIGLVAYTVSPEGAQKLLDSCFPLRDYEYKPYLNFGIDHAVLEEIPFMNTFISIPPLVLTKNDVSMSTVQKQ